MRVLLFILMAGLLSACGQKGPLFLPESSVIETDGVQKKALESSGESSGESAERSSGESVQENNEGTTKKSSKLLTQELSTKELSTEEQSTEESSE